MNRFFGMMPSSEIKKTENFKTDLGTIIVQAGEKGWTVIYADGSSTYEDIDDTTDANFDRALKVLKK